jgi:hypothetical protein
MSRRKRKQSGSALFNVLVFIAVFSVVTTLFIRAAVVVAIATGIVIATNVVNSF